MTPVAAPTVTSVTPSQGATNVAVSVAPTATFSQAVVPSTVSFTLKDSAGNAVAGSLSFDSGNTVATFTPASSLSSSITYTATVSGAQNSSGVAMSSPFSWSFTTAGAQCPCSIWQNGTPIRRGGRERHQRGQPGPEVPGQHQRVHHRRAVLQGIGQHRHAYRQPVELHRHAARQRHVQQRDRVGLAGAGLLQPGGGHRGDDLRGLLPHQHGALCGHQRTGWRRR